MTPNEIAARLAQLSRSLDELAGPDGDAERLDSEAVQARHAFELAYARAFLSAEGSVDARKQKAILATDKVKFEAEIADAKLRACRRHIDTIRVQIDTGRSLGAAVRAEISLAGTGAMGA